MFFACLHTAGRFNPSLPQDSVVTNVQDMHPPSLACQHKSLSLSLCALIYLPSYLSPYLSLLLFLLLFSFNANPRIVFTVSYLSDTPIPHQQQWPGSGNVIDCYTRITGSKGKLHRNINKRQMENILGKQIINAIDFTAEKVN